LPRFAARLALSLAARAEANGLACETDIKATCRTSSPAIRRCCALRSKT